MREKWEFVCNIYIYIYIERERETCEKQIVFCEIKVDKKNLKSVICNWKIEENMVIKKKEKKKKVLIWERTREKECVKKIGGRKKENEDEKESIICEKVVRREREREREWERERERERACGEKEGKYLWKVLFTMLSQAQGRDNEEKWQKTWRRKKREDEEVCRMGRRERGIQWKRWMKKKVIEIMGKNKERKEGRGGVRKKKKFEREKRK